jgi:hypothetical protein
MFTVRGPADECQVRTAQEVAGSAALVEGARLRHGAHAHDFLLRIVGRPPFEQFAGFRLDDRGQTILPLVGRDSHTQHCQFDAEKPDEANARCRQSDERRAIDLSGSYEKGPALTVEKVDEPRQNQQRLPLLTPFFGNAKFCNENVANDMKNIVSNILSVATHEGAAAQERFSIDKSNAESCAKLIATIAPLQV